MKKSLSDVEKLLLMNQLVIMDALQYLDVGAGRPALAKAQRVTEKFLKESLK